MPKAAHLQKYKHVWQSQTPEFVAAVELVQLLNKKGGLAYFAGGAVRDDILGRVPQDYDIVTDLELTEDLLRELALSYKVLPVGMQFGVVKLVASSGVVFDLAPFRKDSATSDGRRPEKVFRGTMEEDAFRRDFTINAMFYDPLEAQVFDFMNGWSDLQDQVLRVVGGNPDLRFQEDYLRILRLFRLAAGLGFHMDGASLEAAARQAEGLKGLSKERIQQEMQKFFQGQFGGLVELMHKHKIWRGFLELETRELPCFPIPFLQKISPDLRWPLWWLSALQTPPGLSGQKSLLQDWRWSQDQQEKLRHFSIGPVFSNWQALLLPEKIEWFLKLQEPNLMLQSLELVLDIEQKHEILGWIQHHQFTLPKPLAQAANFPHLKGRELGLQLRAEYLRQLVNY